MADPRKTPKCDEMAAELSVRTGITFTVEREPYRHTKTERKMFKFKVVAHGPGETVVVFGPFVDYNRVTETLAFMLDVELLRDQ